MKCTWLMVRFHGIPYEKRLDTLILRHLHLHLHLSVEPTLAA
jgi:hypothetical protein